MNERAPYNLSYFSLQIDSPPVPLQTHSHHPHPRLSSSSHQPIIRDRFLMSDGSERAAGPVVVLPRPPDGASLSWGEPQAGRRKGEQGGHVFPGHEVLQSLTQG